MNSAGTLLIAVLGIWFFAAVGSLTAASRCTWAFSRDGGIPFSRAWRTVNPKYDVPVWALLLSTIVCALLGLIYLGSSAAFNAFTGVATICLGCSYAFPVLCSLLRGRKMVRNAPFSLGKFGYAINILTVAWITFSIVLFCFRECEIAWAVEMDWRKWSGRRSGGVDGARRGGAGGGAGPSWLRRRARPHLLLESRLWSERS